ncbi:hypothetical protein LMH87_010354 [Akanthomyces muscarius]|uniref:HIT-type domain-containing protein n=1 Tax=Akanthomyces muscarius TaxID=2231603 RepID=A0A9W8QDU6_AKAMU|nr:hypothetical protein LMH87_010354 [Akanthomyces muscarius]KAJ4153887.1 hypothetical protein LMH87_010354 [Akanthomyces muscarius]
MSSPADTKSAQGNESAQQAADEASKSICGVCQQEPPKYKCPRCYLPYCSVACSKVHRENHPPDPEPKPSEPSQAAAPPTTETPTAAAAAAANANDRSNPFRALDSASDKLQMLFTKYPDLPAQLADIHAATQPPSDEATQNSSIPASLLKGLPSKKDAWNHDVGIKNGKEALRKARRADGVAGEAVREYCELIAYLMNGQAGGAEAAALLQKEAAMQDSELIERLLEEEKRKR